MGKKERGPGRKAARVKTAAIAWNIVGQWLPGKAQCPNHSRTILLGTPALLSSSAVGTMPNQSDSCLPVPAGYLSELVQSFTLLLL